MLLKIPKVPHLTSRLRSKAQTGSQKQSTTRTHTFTHTQTVSSQLVLRRAKQTLSASQSYSIRLLDQTDTGAPLKQPFEP